MVHENNINKKRCIKNMNYKDKTYSIVKLYIVLTGLGPEG